MLLSVAAMGLVGAATVWAVIGDPTCFRSPQGLTRSSRLGPSVYASGEPSSQGRISKNGSRMPRPVLIQVRYPMAGHDRGPLGAFFARKQRQLRTQRAAVALARKVVVVPWQMLCANGLYRGTESGCYQLKLKQLARNAAAVGVSRSCSPALTARVAAKANQKAEQDNKTAAKLPPKLRFHDLRHTFVSRALQAGANPRAVSEIVGHYDPGFTLKRYAHALPQDTKEAVRRLTQHLRRTAPPGADG